MINHRGLERPQDKGAVCNVQTLGFERSQFEPIFNFPLKGLERSLTHSAESLSSSCFG